MEMSFLQPWWKRKYLRSPGPEHDRSSFKAQQLKNQIKAAGARLDNLTAESIKLIQYVRGWLKIRRSTEFQKGVLMRSAMKMV